MDTLYFNDISNQCQVDYQLADFKRTDNTKFYNPVITMIGDIHQNLTLSNDQHGYLTSEITFPAQPEMDFGLTAYLSAGLPWIYFTSWNASPIPFNSRFQMFLQKRKHNSTLFQMKLDFTPGPTSPDYGWETAGFGVFEHDSISIRSDAFGELIHVSTDPFSYGLGTTLMHWSGSLAFSETGLIVYPMYVGFFNRAWGDHERGNVSLELLSDNKLIQKDSVVNGFYSELFNDNTHATFAGVTPEPHTLRATYRDYQVRGKFGKAVAEMTVGSGYQYSVPPVLTKLDLTSAGVSTDQIESGSDATLTINLQNPSSPGINGEFWIRKTGDPIWTPLTVIPSNSDLIATLSDLADGFYSLKIQGKSDAGDAIVYTLEPAFLVGENPDPVPFAKPVLIYPTNYAQVDAKPNFIWSSIASASTKYRLQLSKSTTFSNLEKDTTLALAFLPSDVLDFQTTYFWRVQAVYAHDSSEWSSPGQFFTLSTLPPNNPPPGNTVTAIDTETKESLSVFPNPTTGQVDILYLKKTPGPVRISVKNLLGQEAVVFDDQSESIGEKSITLDLRTTGNDGIYIVIFSDGKTVSAQKVLVKGKS
jgi:hypothetical protein